MWEYTWKDRLRELFVFCVTLVVFVGLLGEILSLSRYVYLFFASGHTLSAQHVIELRCQSGLTSDKLSCDHVAAIASELEITVNPINNTVLVNVIRNNGDYSEESFFLPDCKVANIYNWECKGVIPQKTNNIVGMLNGSYYHSFRYNAIYISNYY